MVSKSQTRRKADIKSKLMAAIAMLLVSSIMMVSSTYAWFTLSTAPEVTGIQTSVGANGNLEMALVPADGSVNDDAIKSSQGDSAKPWIEKNLTWGNLVDVSDASYGLDKIQLYPSALNVSDAGTLGAALLKTPTYGADGRVDSLAENTTTSTYDTTNNSFSNDADHANKFGVRAVGAASGMTDRELAYRNYRSAASTAMVQAQNAATASLKNNGQAIANIAISHATGTVNHTQDEVDSLRAIVVDLLGNGSDRVGALQYIEKAYINYIIAYGASNAMVATMDDTEFSVFASTLEGKATLAEAVAVLETYGIDADAIPGIDELADTIAEVKAAKGELDGLKKDVDGNDRGDNITWSEISSAMGKFIDPNEMTINGKFKAMEAKEHISELIAAVQTGVTVNVKPGSGVYADIADHCGNYKANVTLTGLEYNGIEVDELNATMATESTITAYLNAYAVIVEAGGAPVSVEGSQSMPLSETYGYVIDLAFRTNAAASDLLLQTEAKDRIYNGEGSEEVMGNGSTMTFVSENASFSTEQVKNLMRAIRIVFFRGTTILANAKLDVGNASEGGNSVTAPIRLYTVTAATTTYVEATEGATHYYDEAAGEYKLADAEHPATHKEVTVAAGENYLATADAKITALPQNQAETVSVLVYLDGANITNADVATAGKSATGTMNLQFSSTAQLDPMDYTPLQSQGDDATETPEQGGEGTEGQG